MNHDKLKPILRSVVFACDYDTSTVIKSEELWERIFPLTPDINPNVAIPALYGIIQTSLNLLKELECTDVVVEESISLLED